MNIYETKRWAVTYSNGRGKRIIYAEDELMARKQALAEYRKNKTQMDFSTIDNVIKTIIQID